MIFYFYQSVYSWKRGLNENTDKLDFEKPKNLFYKFVA